ncbi:MAG: isoamylase [Chlamydiales bacterium]
MWKKTYKISRGFPYPFGATLSSNGINFALFSKHASAVSLCLIKPDENIPFCEIPLNPKTHKTGDVWHIFVYELPSIAQYGYRVDGPYDPFKGHYFDNRIVLLDPYAKEVSKKQSSKIHCGTVSPPKEFDWEEDAHPNIPLKELILYEMHVSGFTLDPSSGVEERGTFYGIIDKIPYLKSLGVNAVELMPIHEFNEEDNVHFDPTTKERLVNYWGYSTINFFSPMSRYGRKNKNVIQEFKTLVKELHANGIEVILDVVYNHTAEGNEEGSVLSFKGLENSVYYLLGPNGEYYNFSGCGNTLNCNAPVVRELIRDSLRYWVTEMHVDGFRFDLASILVRSHDGIPLSNPPLIEAITLDPILANTKLIAEAWDAGGLYQVGTFPAMGVWAEWNGKYRDSIRRFLKGTDGEAGSFATRICGSEDLYGKGRFPYHSINFITAHDGFTLADLVSYNEKHNENNGEGNRDGSSDNESWNCGIEGVTDNSEILALRERQMKNFHLTLMISQGVPMISMGDEYGHTKFGNNNSWGHNSRLNWFQWDSLEKSQTFFRFYKMMIAFRKAHPILKRGTFLKENDITWHGVQPNHPNWNSDSRFIACTLPDKINGYTLYIAFNAGYRKTTALLPQLNNPWRQIVYTPLPSPHDIVEEQKAKSIKAKTYTLAPHSALILKSIDRVD